MLKRFLFIAILLFYSSSYACGLCKELPRDPKDILEKVEIIDVISENGAIQIYWRFKDKDEVYQARYICVEAKLGN